MKSETTNTSERRRFTASAVASRSYSAVPPPPLSGGRGRRMRSLQQLQHVQPAWRRGAARCRPVAVQQRADAVAVARHHARQRGDEAGRHGQLGDVAGAEVDAAREVEQEPGGQVAVLEELAHVGLLQPRGDVPVDVAHVVVVLVLAQVGQVDAGAAHQRAVVALQQAVEPAEHRPLQPRSSASAPPPRPKAGGAEGRGAPPASRVASGGLGILRVGQRLVGHRDLLQHALHEVVGAQALGQRLVGQHEAVAQHVGHEVDHVLRQRVARARAAWPARARPRSGRWWRAGWRRR
jgi:hypothetical protein